jgi:surfeit locus 1 family protein
MAAMSSKKFLILTAIAAILFAGFTALGIWQVYRLQWKLDLIAAVDARVEAPALPASPVAISRRRRR